MNPPIVVPGGVVRLALVGGYVWVTNKENTLTLVDPSAGTVSKQLEVGDGPIGLADAGQFVWVANSDDDTVSQIHGESVTVVGTKQTGRAPVGVAGGSGRVFIVNQDDESLTILDSADGRHAGTDVSLGLRPRDVVSTPVGVWTVGVEPSGASLVREER
jgi:DNA-binding beta-propeller fold protein YncE